MKKEIIERLVTLNHEFYQRFAEHFSSTRSVPWHGFEFVGESLPQPCEKFLDVGCGDGRLGRYLLEGERIGHYTGVDFSNALLNEGRTLGTTHFFERNLLTPQPLQGLGMFDAIACIAALHHIPSHAMRVNLLREIRDHLTDGGCLILSTFQFMQCERLRKKVIAWETVGIDSADVEPNDYLVDWKRGGYGVRYIAYIDHAATRALLQEAGFTVVGTYSADGKTNNLNYYVCAEKAPSH
jgi:SAM-dependent methyltransferase